MTSRMSEIENKSLTTNTLTIVGNVRSEQAKNHQTKKKTYGRSDFCVVASHVNLCSFRVVTGGKFSVFFVMNE